MTAVPLTDPWFEAEFYGKAHEQCFTRIGANIDGAQGLFLWCPCGYSTDKCHGLIVPFANPRNAPELPPDHGPTSRDGSYHPRWQMGGDGLHNLTISPSIDVGTDSCWHGHITGGAVT
jgi:hypothetical protein